MRNRQNFLMNNFKVHNKTHEMSYVKFLPMSLIGGATVLRNVQNVKKPIKLNFFQRLNSVPLTPFLLTSNFFEQAKKIARNSYFVMFFFSKSNINCILDTNMWIPNNNPSN